MKKYKRRCFLLAIVLVLSFSASIGVRATEIELQTENIEKEVPAAFYIEMNWGGNGTTIKGFFPGYTEEMERIQTYYSFDGVQFLPINDAVYWTKPEGTLESTILNTTIAISVQSPLKEYLAGDIEEFFICLKYEVDGIEYTSEIVKYIDRKSVV